MRLFSRLVREEWRLQATLFGSRRFAVFPLAIAVMAAGATALLFATETTADGVVAGLHGLAFFFGLQVGTVGLIGQDALRDVLGDLTLLVFSARTLPVSMRRLLATFLVKDVVYYGALFVLPIVAGFGAVALTRGYAPARLALAWLTITATFGLGIAASLTLTGVGARAPAALAVGLAALVIGVVATGVDVVSATPYAVYVSPGPVTLLTGLSPAVALSVAGVLLFEPVESEERGAAGPVDRALGRLASDWDTRRPLLSVARSSGSVWKVAFSLGVLVAVAGLVLEQVTATTGIRPHAGLAFGTLLGLGGFTTYSWVTTFDDPREYLRYPSGLTAVFRGKLRAYLLLSALAGLPYLAVATLWYPAPQVAVGVVVFPLVAVYVYGVAAVVAGLAPTELLFDTARFLAFGAALALLAVPLLVAALAWPVAPLAAPAAAVVLAALSAVVGLALARQAGPRWERRLRAE